ncbi:hypothetical protein, partial [Leptospira sp. id769339]
MKCLALIILLLLTVGCKKNEYADSNVGIIRKTLISPNGKLKFELKANEADQTCENGESQDEINARGCCVASIYEENNFIKSFKNPETPCFAIPHLSAVNWIDNENLEVIETRRGAADDGDDRASFNYKTGEKSEIVGWYSRSSQEDGGPEIDHYYLY